LIILQQTKYTMVDASTIKMVILDVDGTMTNGSIYITEEGMQFKQFNVYDGVGIKRMIASGITVGIISHSLSTGMVTKRAEMLGIEHCYIGQVPKIKVLQEWSAKLQIPLQAIAFVGDDINDLEVMKAVGLSVCPANAVQKIRDIADIILKQSGGDGAIREFADEYILND
jgi:3-deoxy-D-manno-octulosonate 8-phosphate phosphatase (KDO 8-P phosphatase)